MNIKFENFLSENICLSLLKTAKAVKGVEGLKHIGEISGIENTQSLTFLTKLYLATRNRLDNVLINRAKDRKFIDERTASCSSYNSEFKIKLSDPNYQTVLGMTDENGRVVWGPRVENYYQSNGKPIAEVPEYLEGNHVTLFGPPDSAKLAINAMNCFHRKLPSEAPIVEKLVTESKIIPKWGADDEDSKTPIRADLMDAALNLKLCFEQTLTFEDKKKYSLEKTNLAHPIKRFPGLALPCTFLFYEGCPLPLHLYDFALHLFAHAKNPKALTFYVPKLENEEEAAYLKYMIEQAELLLQETYTDYKLGTVKVILVLENPRAIYRVNEIMDELYPYFAGASLGWHDFLASTARCFKEDGNYKIPVKADPDIVIKYIKASHQLLAEIVGSRGGIKIGGMYGVLPLSNDVHEPSFQLTLKGFFRDVITQLKRGLDGFWVAHPDFIRIGIALVHAWKKHLAGDSADLEELTKSLLPGDYCLEIMSFIRGADIESLRTDHPLYARSLLAAVGSESSVIANNDPEEIRYNVFQTLQYLADWLSGNGCVALPAHINAIAVRVMDDLATAERSRWEVWHEIKSGRFDLFKFLKIAHEEYLFIRKNKLSKNKIVQVKWDDRTSKWYPVAFKLMVKLMTDSKPVEFATELLLPFTCDQIREHVDPWVAASTLDADKYELSNKIRKLNYYFEMCGTFSFAKTLSVNTVIDEKQIQQLISNFSVDEVLEAMSFHGDIGGSKTGLDAHAVSEQLKVKVNEELSLLANKYLSKFGFKYMVSAKGKSDEQLLEILKLRIDNTREQELKNAKGVLAEITLRRVREFPINNLRTNIEKTFANCGINAAQVCLIDSMGVQQMSLGDCSQETHFQMASLSKTLASSCALYYFNKNKIALNSLVNELLSKTSSKFRIPNGDKVEILHLLNHTALNLHYVNGVPLNEEMPKIENFLQGNSEYNYEPIGVMNQQPGQIFNYSGGGFLVLEHLMEALSGKSAALLMKDFLNSLGIDDIEFNPNKKISHHAKGYDDLGKEIATGRKLFPAFAAGASSNAQSLGKYLRALENAYHDLNGVGLLSHEVSCSMLQGMDLGSKEFMGAKMGAGVFIAEAQDNSFALHQGANDGFRAIFLHCFKGPDRGKGIVVLSNADLKGVVFNAQVVQLFLKEAEIKGIDYSKFASQFDAKNIASEKIVNLGYKKLIFDAFMPRQPEKILTHGELDPLAAYNCSIGAEIIHVTNERFARAENLISKFQPTFNACLFGKEGKIMDSWESVRHNYLAADVLTLKLTKTSDINYIRLSTKFHFGNHAPKVSIDYLKDNEWEALLPEVELEGHSQLSVKLPKTVKGVKDLKISMIPDGGLTRLGLFESLPEREAAEFLTLGSATSLLCKEKIPQTAKPLNIAFTINEKLSAQNLSKLKNGAEFNNASAYYGAKILSASNEHYSPASTMLSPYGPIHMFDGLESARSRTKGHFDEVVLQLAVKAKIHRYVFDFSYFVNNNPKEISLLGFDGHSWHKIFDHYRVKQFAGNGVALESHLDTLFEQIKIQTWPDGGLNRFKAFSYYQG